MAKKATYEVSAAHGESGKEAKLYIKAHDPAEAVVIAQRDGYMVASVLDDKGQRMTPEQAGVPPQRKRVHDPMERIAECALIRRPVRTIAAGVLMGTLATAGLVLLALFLRGLVGGLSAASEY